MNEFIFNNNILLPILNNIQIFSERNAFCINDVEYTYKDLGRHISKVRLSLREISDEEKYIGIVANDDIETYASILAIWIEGKAYVPLHPKQPFERNIEIINQMSIKTILDSTRSASSYVDFNTIQTSCLEFTYEFFDIKNNIDDNRSSYVLFTSGSTGKPKGVVINRKNIGAFVASFWETGIVITEEDKCLQTFDLTFDVSVQAFLIPLIKGACVYTVPHNQIKYSYVYGLLEDHNLTFAVMAPSMIRYLKPYFCEINLQKLKYCIVTAEASPLSLLLEWKKCIKNAEIYNFYGPTEATIYCTYYKLNGEKSKTLNGMLSIGIPLNNVECLIVDNKLQPVPLGTKGELCVSGKQVTDGYWNNEARNETSFFIKNDKRFYKTGDLCYLEDNQIMLYGRLDSQVKIQGYRIELGEIEFHISSFLNGINVVVLGVNNSLDNTELVAFIETEANDSLLLEKNILKYLKTKLPSYMLPLRYVHMSAFPLNANGKIDKVKLKQKIENV